MYQIAELENLTGIKAHTIRIWEKRYDIVNPHRTDTNIRYYDDEQLKTLLNISTLISSGYKISKVAKMSGIEIKKAIDTLLGNDNKNNIALIFINDLIQSMFMFNDVFFEKTLNSALTKLGVYQTMIEVVYPFLKKIGVMWTTDDLIPAQEHFASTIIRRKLMRAIDDLNSVSKSNKRVLLFLPQDEWHDIALLFSEYILKFAKINVINLGQNVPYDNVLTTLRKTKTNYALTFFVSRKNKQDIETPLLELVKKHKGLNVLVGVSRYNSESIPKHKNIFALMNPEELRNYFS